ncbi:MAG: hypothetical protein LUG18_07480 [Candidatus Azobacteroides sp.]|nr:hypothetical protein [Candidatus Azobacteroides sp.]
MKWKRYFFNPGKKLFLFFSFFSFFVQGYGENRYEERVINYQNKWNNLIPKYTKVQFAGGMGVLSFGTGWDYGKNKQWETDALFGFIPKFQTDKFRITFTLKQNFIPWHKDLNDSFTFDPLTCGLYANTILNGDYWISEPDKYPNNYYSFSTKIRFNIFIGQRITYQISEEKRKARKSVTFYYEIGTNELYLISAFGNRYLKPTDYLKLSLGMKAQIF